MARKLCIPCQMNSHGTVLFGNDICLCECHKVIEDRLRKRKARHIRQKAKHYRPQDVKNLHWRMRTIALRDGDWCWWCGRTFVPGHGYQFRRTVDHVMPKALGGTNGTRNKWAMYPTSRCPKDLSNLVLCCAMCNQAKGDMHPAKWVRKIIDGEVAHINKIWWHAPDPVYERECVA